MLFKFHWLLVIFPLFSLAVLASLVFVYIKPSNCILLSAQLSANLLFYLFLPLQHQTFMNTLKQQNPCWTRIQAYGVSRLGMIMEKKEWLKEMMFFTEQTFSLDLAG